LHAQSAKKEERANETNRLDHSFLHSAADYLYLAHAASKKSAHAQTNICSSLKTFHPQLTGTSITYSFELPARRRSRADLVSTHMSVPIPPVDLEGHCSTVVGDTLYVLSPGAFQSLPLKKNAKWQKEATGVKVTGPACVTVTPNGDDTLASLWVIGGTTDASNYDGLQVYSFARKAWQSLHTPVANMQGRTNHSAAYLQDSQSILVYAGAQKHTTNTLSSETFVISTNPPYNILSYTSNAPPANIPILQPWDTNSAVMVGGSVLNTQVSIFSIATGWTQLGTDLVTPLNPGMRGTLVDGTDGSKVLEVYDANVSPNTVTQIVLLGADGTAAQTGQIIGQKKGSALRNRALMLSDWPPYNGKLAPTAKRSDFSVAQNTNGVAVMAGGNNNSPVVLFNQDTNGWLDAGKFFNPRGQKPLKPTSTHSRSKISKTSSSTSTNSSGSKNAAATGQGGHDQMLRVLGIILGVLAGVAILFALILFCLRRRKLKKRERVGWVEEKPSSDKHVDADGGAAAFMKESGARGADLQPPPNTHWRQSNGSSMPTSLGVISSKFNKKRFSTKGVGGDGLPRTSNDSTARLVPNRPVISAPMPMAMPTSILELSDIEKRPAPEPRMAPRTERSDRTPPAIYGANLTAQNAQANDGTGKVHRNRSSGWSKYFATSAPTGPNGLGHIPSAYVSPAEASTIMTTPNTTQHSRIPSSQAVPAAIDTGRTIDGQPVSQVAMGSPAFNDSRRGSTVTVEAQKGKIVDPNSRESQGDSISSYDRSQASSRRTSAFHEASPLPWSPADTSTSFKDHLNSRPRSSSHDPTRPPPSRGGNPSPFFAGGTSSYRPSRSPRPPAGLRQAEPRDSNVTVWPGHKSQFSADYSKPAEQRATQMETVMRSPESHYTSDGGFGVPAFAVEGVNARDSNVTVFPGGPTAIGPRAGAAPAPGQDNDLAWLNLGLHNGSQTRL